jgi:Fur family ferric uptake transcriptional regulator
MERNTKQREAIWQSIQSTRRPLSPQEVLAAARTSVPRLGIATVYRTIKALAGEGKLVPVAIPGEPARYEIAGLKHHHHFYCRTCGKVYELDGCLLANNVSAPEGFKVQDHEVTLYGTCAKCEP